MKIYTLWDQLGSISSWLGIISFFITIYLMITTGGIKRRLQSRDVYNSFLTSKQTLRNELKGVEKLLIADINDERKLRENIGDLITLLRRVEMYKPLMKRKDKRALNNLNHILMNERFDQNLDKCIAHVSLIIGFLEINPKKEY